MANKFYNTRKWRDHIRPQHLKEHPLCVFCEKIGRVTAATVVDHIKPHKGDERLFYDRRNLQSLCKQCHDSNKQAMERSGVMKFAFDENGNPIGYVGG
jgi:5-methylcytosine-specific restriction protein A